MAKLPDYFSVFRQNSALPENMTSMYNFKEKFQFIQTSSLKTISKQLDLDFVAFYFQSIFVFRKSNIL